jgi:hypothetical protein
MKVTIYSDDRVLHNGAVLTDVIWADAEAGEAEIYEHTSCSWKPSERIVDADNPSGYRTLIVKGEIRIQNVRAAGPAQGSFDYGWCEGNPYPCGFTVTDVEVRQQLINAILAFIVIWDQNDPHFRHRRSPHR